MTALSFDEGRPYKYITRNPSDPSKSNADPCLLMITGSTTTLVGEAASTEAESGSPNRREILCRDFRREAPSQAMRFRFLGTLFPVRPAVPPEKMGWFCRGSHSTSSFVGVADEGDRDCEGGVRAPLLLDSGMSKLNLIFAVRTRRSVFRVFSSGDTKEGRKAGGGVSFLVKFKSPADFVPKLIGNCRTEYAARSNTSPETPKSFNQITPENDNQQQKTTAKWRRNWRLKSVTAFFMEKVFEWDQTLDEVNMYITLPKEVPTKLFYCKIQSKHVEVGIKGNPPYLNHDLSSAVKTDSSFWTIGQTWPSPIAGQGQLDPYVADLEQKRLMLQRFQEENPGFDFSQAQFSGDCPDPRTFMGGIRFS
ncbi:hypothetical protein OSB04_027201 [Centaurea solstitialis]|uniref:CS domain-containing protein n=1 Tax=Centaurea solstitialis TaxID=347529 RepID=A0AA38W6M0_9ASTR|nr:hypothetical protein OSB04_027201 [Centaurea solstitialis]